MFPAGALRARVPLCGRPPPCSAGGRLLVRFSSLRLGLSPVGALVRARRCAGVPPPAVQAGGFGFVLAPAGARHRENPCAQRASMKKRRRRLLICSAACSVMIAGRHLPCLASCARAVRPGTFARGRRGRLGLSRLSASRGGWRLKAGPLPACGPAGSGRAPPRACFPRASWRCGLGAARSPRPGGGRLWAPSSCPAGGGLGAAGAAPGPPCPSAGVRWGGGLWGAGAGPLLAAVRLSPPSWSSLPSWWVVLAPPPPLCCPSPWGGLVVVGGCGWSLCHPPVGRLPFVAALSSARGAAAATAVVLGACAAAALVAGGGVAARASRSPCACMLLMNCCQLVFSTWFVICT